MNLNEFKNRNSVSLILKKITTTTHLFDSNKLKVGKTLCLHLTTTILYILNYSNLGCSLSEQLFFFISFELYQIHLYYMMILKAFKIVPRQALKMLLTVNKRVIFYYNHEISRSHSKSVFLSLCLFLSSCFHAVKGIRLEPT